MARGHVFGHGDMAESRFFSERCLVDRHGIGGGPLSACGETLFEGDQQRENRRPTATALAASLVPRQVTALRKRGHSRGSSTIGTVLLGGTICMPFNVGLCRFRVICDNGTILGAFETCTARNGGHFCAGAGQSRGLWRLPCEGHDSHPQRSQFPPGLR